MSDIEPMLAHIREKGNKRVLVTTHKHTHKSGSGHNTASTATSSSSLSSLPVGHVSSSSSNRNSNSSGNSGVYCFDSNVEFNPRTDAVLPWLVGDAGTHAAGPGHLANNQLSRLVPEQPNHQRGRSGFFFDDLCCSFFQNTHSG